MQAVKLNEKVTDNGLFIPLEKVKDFKNEDVEVIILPSTNKQKLSKTHGWKRKIKKVTPKRPIDLDKIIEEGRV